MTYDAISPSHQSLLEAQHSQVMSANVAHQPETCLSKTHETIKVLFRSDLKLLAMRGSQLASRGAPEPYRHRCP